MFASGELKSDEILRVSGLQTHFHTEDGIVRAIDGVDLALKRGETVAIVGESGSGKSVTCLSIMRLIQHPGRVAAGEILFRGKAGAVCDLLKLDESAMRKIRGNDIAMIFQEPMTSLNPVFRVGDQIAEAVIQHRGVGAREAVRMAAEMLRRVGIADPEQRVQDYPHQMSGGMRQRVMIAMALSCDPAVLVADEPTTALDVTIQAQILDLMRTLRGAASQGMSIMFITHNMGVVAEIADRVMVMYAGQTVEEAPVRELFKNPRHPYTRGLLASIPRGRGGSSGRRVPLQAIPGAVPNPLERLPGCAFAPRCGYALDACRAAPPPLAQIDATHATRCIRWSAL